jgi:hypothetical protein
MNWPGTVQRLLSNADATEQPDAVVCVAWMFHLMLVHCFWKEVERFQGKSLAA